MIELTVKDIARVTDGKLVSKDENAVVWGFSIDSRTICPGEFFIAVKGQNFDGHDFIGAAVQKGAAGILAERDVSSEYGGKIDHVLTVEDSREAMGRIAAEIRNRARIPVVCATGTSGKTTLKEMLSCLLSSKYNVLKSKKSYNNIIGLSLTLFGLSPSHDVAVLELGTNRPGEISDLAQIARPSVCVITNIGDGHLEFLKDRDGVFAEKVKLLDFLKDSGAAFLNSDDPLLKKVSAEEGAIRFFGTSGDPDFRITDIKKEKSGYSFSLGGSAFFVPLEGEHNVYNAAAAIAVSRHLGVGDEEIRSKMKEMTLPGMRLERVEAGGVTFINDSYNANPDSFKCALEVLRESPTKGKRIVVAGDMMELGAKTTSFHEIIGKSIAGKNIDFLITIGGMAEHIARGALESGMARENVVRVGSHEEAADIIRRVAKAGDIVLVKGSRASKMEEVLRCFTTYCIH
ncbi:MAG: UDP-N-acetylmuramoyl-tripeptide--D-alanyl-D-alanine ligase [Candidatus Omnitrophota bacterium]